VQTKRPDLVVSSDDYLYFVERAVRGMCAKQRLRTSGDFN